MTLIDWIPWDGRAFEHLRKYWGVEVIREVDGCKEPWPGKHKNVWNLCVLANGKAIGFNENPAVGWSFPVINIDVKHATDK